MSNNLKHYQKYSGITVFIFLILNRERERERDLTETVVEEGGGGEQLTERGKCGEVRIVAAKRWVW